MQRVTANDVAKRAGVSRGAVSVVLNDSKSNIRVSEETRQRILAAATELSYTPNRAAQHLRRRRSGIIAFVFNSSGRSLYERPIPYHFSSLILRAAARHNYHVVEVNSGGFPSCRSNLLLDFLLKRQVDGAIFGWSESADEVQSVIDSGLPVVQIMKPQFAAKSPTITVDASLGINRAVDYLAELGHRRIAYLGTHGSHPVDRARLSCFVGALQRHGIPVRDKYIGLRFGYSLEKGHEFTHTLLALSKPPTALCVIEDGFTLGALRALYEARVRIPDMMSVVGFHDLLASSLYPPLTSVVQPVQEVADCAVSLLEGRITGTGDETQTSTHVILPTQFKVRDSTGRPYQ